MPGRLARPAWTRRSAGRSGRLRHGCPRASRRWRWPRSRPCCAGASRRWAGWRRRRQSTSPETPLPADADPSDNPTVYASRYGETGRCLELLADQARGDALSPTAFGLSVHNAIGAMIALTRGDRRNSSAIAAGRATAAAGVVEALGLLDDGAECASLIVYDSPLPDGYAAFEDEPSAHFAWAWRLRRPRAGERALHLRWQAAGRRRRHRCAGPVARQPAGAVVRAVRRADAHAAGRWPPLHLEPGCLSWPR